MLRQSPVAASIGVLSLTLVMPHSRVAKSLSPGDNREVERVNHSDTLAPAMCNPFRAGIMVVVTLGNPREKVWGAILALSAEGLSLCGIELASFDDLISLLKDGEPFSPGVVFFPMHRVERMELDLPDGSIPSLSQRFTNKTGLDPATVLLRHGAVNANAVEELK
jgi:hypothetical protein